MNKSIFPIIAVISVFFYTSCKRDNRERETTGISKEIIDFYSSEMPSYEIRHTCIPEKLIQGRTCIKPDHSQEDVLFSGIDKIRLTNDRIYVLDRELMKLAVFKNDKYIMGTLWDEQKNENLYSGQA
jgi:hypothetical protein